MQKTFDFVGAFKKFAIASIALVIVGIVLCFVLPPKLSIQFSGGSKITYEFTGDISTDKVESTLKDVIKKSVKADISTDISGGSKKLNVSLADREALTTKQVDDMMAALEKAYPNAGLKQLSLQTVSPTMGVKTLIKSLWAVVLAGAFIVIYVAIRFRKIGGWTAGLSALVALAMDVFVAFFVCIIFRLGIDNNFIAVVLTIFGYSINSTIVVFDRVRENRRLEGSKTPLDELVNRSLWQVLRRNVMTSLSTVIAIATVAIVAEVMGLSTLRSLTIPMAVGLISGAFSSLCIAPPLWVVWQRGKKAKPVKAKRYTV